MYGNNVLIQWRYITANSCFPPGYKDTAVGEKLQELGWLRADGMSDCTYPYDPTGATGHGKPEQFWNCAEITIHEKGPTPPTPPTPPTTASPVVSPTKAPVGHPTPGYCSYSGIWDQNSEYFIISFYFYTLTLPHHVPLTRLTFIICIILLQE